MSTTDQLEAEPNTDREGIALARERDAEIESGQLTPLSHEEFRRRTRGMSE